MAFWAGADDGVENLGAGRIIQTWVATIAAGVGYTLA